MGSQHQIGSAEESCPALAPDPVHRVLGSEKKAQKSVSESESRAASSPRPASHPTAVRVGTPAGAER